VLPGVGGEELHLVGGPAAFGADGKGDGFVWRCVECGGYGVVLFGFGEEKFCGCGDESQCGGERLWVVDGGDVGAAGLLGGLECDATPAVYTFGSGEGEMLFGAASEDGRDARGTELGGFFDGPLEVIELEDGEEKMDGECGVGFEFFVKGEDDLAIGDGDDLGTVEETVGDDVVDLSGLGAEDASEMCGLIAGERCGGGGEGIGDEAAARHADRILRWRDDVKRCMNIGY